MAEAELYGPVKSFLEAQGYEVKGEIGACDLVAIRGDEPPVVVELKERFSLALVLQAVDRLALTNTVYMAFRIGAGHSAAWRRHRKQLLGLGRRLGVGLLTVSAADRVVAVLDPGPYSPRGSARRRARLLREFGARVGDPEVGGSTARKRLTAYRQDALKCAQAMVGSDLLKVSVIRERTGVARAGDILRHDHYGWFERVKTGHYALSPRGRRELVQWTQPGAGDA